MPPWSGDERISHSSKASPARVLQPSALSLYAPSSLLRGICFLRGYCAEKGTNWIEKRRQGYLVSILLGSDISQFL